MVANQLHQLRIESRKGHERGVYASLGEGTSTGHAQQIGLLCQVRKEGVLEFVLDTGLEARDHRGQQDRNNSHARTSDTARCRSESVEKFVGAKVLRKADKNRVVLRCSC